MTYEIIYRNTNLIFMSDNFVSRKSSWKQSLFYEVHVKLSVMVTVKVKVNIKLKIKVKLSIIWIEQQATKAGEGVNMYA